MRRHLPLLGAVLFVLSSGLSSLRDYRSAMAAHAWTGASITMGLGVIFAIIAAFLGWFLGKSLRALAEPEGDKKKPALVAALIILFTGYFSVATALNRQRAARYKAVSAETLTVARARELLSTGNPADKSAVSYNRSCPSDILRELALDADVNVRANVAANPATPDDAARKLLLDKEEIVRYYASFHPSQKK